MSKHFSASMNAMQTALETLGAKKFELENVVDLDTVLNIYLTDDGIFAFVCTSDDDLQEKMESFPLTQHDIRNFVNEYDLMFGDSMEDGQPLWKKYPKHIELLEALAPLAPNTNFAVDFNELRG